MEAPFKIKIANNQLSATIELADTGDSEFSITEEQLIGLLRDKGIVHGLDRKKIEEIAKNPYLPNYPLVIAKGTPPEQGEDAYLTAKVEIKKEKKTFAEEKKVNFRDVLNIPSVKKGQVIAKVVPETPGKNGISVTGRPIPARRGKPLAIRLGKNVTREGNEFLASIDGQVSITNRAISVNPVFEVRGDLDLKTGNIDFVGNVIIRGNVPTGYEINAGGDIKIYGLVEGSDLKAQGNIYISGGVNAGNRGSVIAEGNVQAAYLNQAVVQAGQDVIVNSSLLHSNVRAAGSIICKTGKAIGGELIAGKQIYIKDLGNRLYTRTEVYVGHDPSADKKEMDMKEELKEISSNINKLNALEHKLLELINKGGGGEKEKTLLMKQRLTKSKMLQRLDELNRELQSIDEERFNGDHVFIEVYGTVYPNTILHIGKYIKPIQTEHTFVKFYAAEGEIQFEPIH